MRVNSKTSSTDVIVHYMLINVKTVFYFSFRINRMSIVVIDPITETVAHTNVTPPIGSLR